MPAHPRALLGLVLACLGWFAAGPSCQPAGEATAEPRKARHVILIVADTLRADHLSAYGYPEATSPQLEVRARSGTLFEHAYAAAPWTLPSLASLMTSTWPRDHGAGLHGEERNLLHQVPTPLAETASATLAECFKAAGYPTAAIVTNPFFGFGLGRGFDHVDAPYGSDAIEVVARGEKQLDAWGDRGGLLYLHFMDAHDPLAPDPSDLRTLHPDRDLPATPQSLHDIMARLHLEETRAERQWVYDASIRRIDRALERLMKFLEERGWLDEAIVIFTADHGEALWEHERIERWHYDRGASAGMGHGQSLFQELMGVPLIVWAKELDAGRASVPVSLVDIAPSVLEWLDCPVPQHFATRGLSLRAAAANTIGARDLVLEGIGMGRERRALVNSAGIKAIAGDGALEPALTYDNMQDPGDADPLAAEGRGLALHTRITGPAPLAQHHEVQLDATPAALESLRGLGYLSGAEVGLPQRHIAQAEAWRELSSAELREEAIVIGDLRATSEASDASVTLPSDSEWSALVALPGAPHPAGAAAFVALRARSRALVQSPSKNATTVRLPSRGELRLGIDEETPFTLAAQLDGQPLFLPLASAALKLPQRFEGRATNGASALPPIQLAPGLHVFRDPWLHQWRIHWLPRPGDADQADRVTLTMQSERELRVQHLAGTPLPHPSWSLLAETTDGWRAVGSISDPPLEGEAAVQHEGRIWIAGAGPENALWLCAFAFEDGALSARERLRLPLDHAHRVQRLSTRGEHFVIDILGAEGARRLTWRCELD